MTEEVDIKTMKLYNHVERIQNELKARDMLQSESIDPIELSKIDSMHYEGNDAIEDAIAAMKLTQSSNILDVGSGFGGISRVLCSKSKCKATALELQKDISDMAKYLTKKCKLDKYITHEVGDILSFNLDKLGSGKESYDGIVSFLVFLHIPDKASLLKNCAAMLKAGGSIFIEDYYCISPFTESEVKTLAEDVYSKDLPTKEEYISALTEAGFDNVQFIDKTNDWTAYVNERVEAFISNRHNYEKIHGEATYLSLLHFYTSVSKLFKGQHLGGVRIIAEKV